MKITDIDIIILGTHHKHILTAERLGHATYTIYYNSDWDMPPLPMQHKLAQEPQSYRASRGHQESMKLVTRDVGLILEDDASPNCQDWVSAVEDSCDLLDRFDIVSLHARSVRDIKDKIVHNNRTYVTLHPTDRDPRAKNIVWALGSLAYLVRRSAIQRLSTAVYDGLPWDLFLYNSNSCVLLNSPFDHDRQYGSIVEGRFKPLGKQRGTGPTANA